MARRVIFHVGLPKTGTTYLQTIMWNNRKALRSQGVLLPGRSAREHLWASAVVREDPKISRRGSDAPGAWARLVAAVNAWPDTAVVSHEFLSGAGAEQAARAIAAVGDAEVHVVLTARDTLGLVTARWQEFVKNGSTREIDRYPADETTNPHNEWDWGTMDAADVLERWGATLPPERVHVITLPPAGSAPDELWRRFAGVLGIDPDSCDIGGSEQNESLGVVEVELLRRVNADLVGFRRAIDRGMWIRGYLAQGKLVPRKGEKFWPARERIDELTDRSRRIAARLDAAGYHVVGDLQDLVTPDDVPERRHPASVTDAELLDAATSTIAAMLTDVRELRQQLTASRQSLEQAQKDLASATPGARLTALRGSRPRMTGLLRRLRSIRGNSRGAK